MTPTYYGVSRGHWLILAVLLSILADVSHQGNAYHGGGEWLTHTAYSFFGLIAFIFGLRAREEGQ